MKRLLALLGIVVVLALTAAPAFAADGHMCDHYSTTIESLHHCVVHAQGMGHITKQGVAKSLMAKVDAAQASLDRGNAHTAANQLRAFINEVNAQSGKGIQADHAAHLVMHAEKVIAALGG